MVLILNYNINNNKFTFHILSKIITPFLIQNALKGAVISEKGDADCAFSMRNGVKIIILNRT